MIYSPAAVFFGRFRQLGQRTVLMLILLVAPAAAQVSFETAAPTAIMTDYASGTVLFEKNADEPVPPASLAKLMTTEVIFNELKQGRLSLDDEFTVSEYAWQTGGASSGGSTMFLPVHSSVSVGDLLKGIIIQSGNDATIVAAEGIAGSTSAFADMMNRRAEEIGLKNSHFTNSHGLPDPDQYVTMRDMAILAAHLIREYPDYYKWFSEEEFTYNDITQHNRNPLLEMGADGLKTGYTSKSGYSLVASAERDGRRAILAMSGLDSARQRAQEARKLMEHGFRAFEEVTLLSAGQPAGEVRVVGGEEESVALVPREDVRVLAPRGGADAFSKTVVSNDPVEAPVAQGDQIGMLQISKDGSIVREVPLHAAKEIGQAALPYRMWDALMSYLGGRD